MKAPITIYDRATGRILRWKRVDFGNEPILLRESEDWIAGRIDDGAFYIDPETGAPTPLKAFDVTVETNRITGIPAGASAIVDLERVPGLIDDGELTITVNLAHVAIVTLQCPLYVPLLEIEVPCEP